MSRRNAGLPAAVGPCVYSVKHGEYCLSPYREVTTVITSASHHHCCCCCCFVAISTAHSCIYSSPIISEYLQGTSLSFSRERSPLIPISARPAKPNWGARIPFLPRSKEASEEPSRCSDRCHLFHRLPAFSACGLSSLHRTLSPRDLHRQRRSSPIHPKHRPPLSTAVWIRVHCPESPPRLPLGSDPICPVRGPDNAFRVLQTQPVTELPVTTFASR